MKDKREGGLRKNEPLNDVPLSPAGSSPISGEQDHPGESADNSPMAREQDHPGEGVTIRKKRKM